MPQSGFQGVGLVIDPVIALRTFNINPSGYLVGPFKSSFVFHSGPNSAKCQPTRGLYPPPKQGSGLPCLSAHTPETWEACSCGFYAYYSLNGDYIDSFFQGADSFNALAVVKLTGNVIQGSLGMRSERLEVLAVAADNGACDLSEDYVNTIRYDREQAQDMIDQYPPSPAPEGAAFPSLRAIDRFRPPEYFKERLYTLQRDLLIVNTDKDMMYLTGLSFPKFSFDYPEKGPYYQYDYYQYDPARAYSIAFSFFPGSPRFTVRFNMTDYQDLMAPDRLVMREAIIRATQILLSQPSLITDKLTRFDLTPYMRMSMRAIRGGYTDGYSDYPSTYPTRFDPPNYTF